MDCFGLTDSGLKRPTNQDHYLIADLNKSIVDLWLATGTILDHFGIVLDDGSEFPAEVVGFSGDRAYLMPMGELHGLSSGDFGAALEQFLGTGAGLSASTITRLTAQWQDEAKAFADRDLSGTDFVYLWVDGIHLKVRLEQEKLCLLVMIGVRADGRLTAVEASIATTDTEAAVAHYQATGKKTLLTPFYNGFNKVFGAGTDAYVSFAGILARKMFRSLAFIGVLIYVIVVLVRQIPGGFVPEEDQGYIMINAQLPDAASLERTDAIGRQVDPYGPIRLLVEDTFFQAFFHRN